MNVVRLLCFGLVWTLGCLGMNVAQGDFSTIAGWDQQVFPSYLLATGALKSDGETPQTNVLGDPNGQFGIQVVAPAADCPIKVTVSCPEFMEPSEFSGNLPTAGETYTVTPKIRYRFDRLGECRQATPATVTIRLQLGDQAPEEVATAVTFRSVNDCPLQVTSGGQNSDTSFTFAAYVNEQHPFVDKLLREALDLPVVERFTGYQSGDRQEVIRQVYALWDLMVARDMRYSDITTTAANSEEILSQHVRLIEDTVNNGQANCVDGSVLFVSLLRKIGINAGLVLEPGHCYVAFQLDEQGESILALETTAMDHTVDDSEELPDVLDDAVPFEKRGVRSWASFVKAICIATDKLVSDDPKFGSAESPDYRIINVAQARKQGVLPIPYKGTEEFLGYDYSEYVDNEYGEGNAEEYAEEDDESSDEEWESDEMETDAEFDAEEEDSEDFDADVDESGVEEFEEEAESYDDE